MNRLFLAIAADSLEGALNPWMKKLKTGADRKELNMRWVPADLRHITILFFGEKTPEERQRIVAAITPIIAETPPFTLKIEGLDAFPEQQQGRVVWMGVQNSKKLRALRDRLAEPLRAEAFTIEERFTPHMTLGRLRSPKSLTDYLSPFSHVNLGKMEVRELVLYESIQAGAFPVYEKRARFALTGVPSDELERVGDDPA